MTLKGLSSAMRMRMGPISAARSAASASSATPSARMAGRAKANVDPSPSTLSTQMTPPVAPRSAWRCSRPRPVPPNFRVLSWSPWLKLSKIFSCLSSGMPMPVSLTRTTKPLGMGLGGRAPSGQFRQGAPSKPSRYTAFQRELDGVSDEVDQHLIQPARIAKQVGGKSCVGPP